MKYYVVGFAFNKTGDKVLLIKKKRPEWQKGKWNGIGGKIGDKLNNLSESPLHAMHRETKEETNSYCAWELVSIFTCPGGTVYFYRSFSGFDGITYEQIEDEELAIWRSDALPENIDPDLKWIIPLCLSNNCFPIYVHQKEQRCP